MNRKFSKFENDELYVLKRQAIESSYKIMMSGMYDPAVGETHSALMNEIVKEMKKRNIEEDYQEYE
ncbi:MAG TPA: hypothetical protein DEF30_08325 [Proteiniclasticum sp.]|uniref:hypothetical protein n=1 Tax=Proteiniclasticum sp. TaxID=2053595 RepID=UPI000E9463FB|nr:hypothetical protein [Proteiniclasticum sp.]HBW13806.1 hypothetical protein [Proteiniclasticum sp.]